MKKIILHMAVMCFFLGTAAFSHAEFDGKAEYPVGIDDILEINVLEPEKLTATVTVAPDGFISFPYIGSIQVKNMTLSKIQEEMQKKLSDGYMKYPVVAVSLKESRSRKFFVYGDISKPGAYPLEENTTVVKAVSIAGGFSKYGSSSRVKLLRPKASGIGNETIEINVRAALQGSAEADTMLQPGDTVMVSEGKFFVYGDISKPGAYPLEENTTVVKAVSIAGGFSKYGSSSRVKLLRPKASGIGNETIEINVRAALQGSAEADTMLQPGDTVMVSEGKFFVYGDVAKPGAYPMEEDTTVLKAVSIAGGFLKNGLSSQVKVIRPTAKEYATIEVNMKAVLQGSSQADIPLCSGDTVMVAEGKFYVYGEVNKPGVYSMEGDTSVLKAIAIAGGFTKYGSASKVKVLRPKTGEINYYETIKVDIKNIMEGLLDSDIMLIPGDTVVVMEGMF